MKRWSAILLVSIALCGCENAALLFDIIKGKFIKPEVQFQRMDSVAASFEKLTVNFIFDVTNPNNAGLYLAGYDCHLAVEGITILESRSSNEVTLPPKVKQQLVVPITIVYKDVLSAFKVVREFKSAAYLLSGGVKFRGAIAEEVRVPLSVSGQFPILRPPKISINNIKATDASVLKGMVIDLELGVENPNIVDFLMKDTVFDLTVNRSTVAQCVIENRTLPKEVKSPVTVRLKVSSASIISGLVLALAEDNIDYKIRGTMDLGFGLLPTWKHAFESGGKVKLR